MTRAQGDLERQSKTDRQVDCADGGNAEDSPEKQPGVRLSALTDEADADKSGGKGDMSDVQRQAEKDAENSGSAEQETKEEIARQCPEVVADVTSNTL